MNDAALVYVGLGSNLDDPRRQLLDAMDELDRLPGTRLRRRSSLYRSAPMGPQDQPDFINAVAELETGLQPEPLLDALQGIEAAHGRVRERRWGPRTLDLDILIYKNEQIRTERLVVPHPGLPRRAFVLYPLAELAPGLTVPGQGRVSDLLAKLDDTAERLEEDAGARAR